MRRPIVRGTVKSNGPAATAATAPVPPNVRQPQPVNAAGFRCSAALTGRDRGVVCRCEVGRTHVHHMVEHISRVVPTQATERGVAIVRSTALALLIWSIAIAKFQVKIFRVCFSDKSLGIWLLENGCERAWLRARQR